MNDFFEVFRFFLFILVFILGFSVAVVGIVCLIRGMEKIEREPAIYQVKRVYLKPEYEEYNIYQSEKLIAIVNLCLEDFQHQLSETEKLAYTE